MTREAAALQSAPASLTLRPNGNNAYEVEVSGLVVGQIIALKRSFGRTVWFWSLSGPHLPETMQGAGSNASTLPGAKAAIKSAFDAWMEAATGKRGDISWSPSP